jgi:outer membrane protein OmpA-like peptidoglycan-associated protein
MAPFPLVGRGIRWQTRRSIPDHPLYFMKKVTPFLLFLCACLLVGIFLPKLYLNDKLTGLAKAKLTEAVPQGLFDKLEVSFAGQVAELKGKVPSDADRKRAESLVQNDIRWSGLIGGGLNPVWRVNNLIEVDTTLKNNFRHPWQTVTAARDGSLTVYGRLNNQAEADAVLAGLKASNPDVAADKLTSKVILDPKTRPGSDATATATAAPKLDTTATAPGTYAFTSVDGTWTQRPSTDSALDLVSYWTGQGATSVELAPAVDALQATLPKAPGWLALADAEPAVVVAGVVPSDDVKAEVIKKVGEVFPGRTVQDKLTLSKLVSSENLKTTLDAMPKSEPTGWVAAAKAGDATWTIFKEAPDLDKAKAALAAIVPASYDSNVLTFAWQKAQDAKARAEAMAKARAAADPALASRWGWSVQDKKATLFGLVPDEAAKTRVGTSFTTAYPDLTLTNKIVLDPKLNMPEAAIPLEFPKPADDIQKDGWVGFGGRGLPSKTYGNDVFDSEIQKDFPQLNLSADQLDQWLTPWRLSLAEAGTLKKEGAYFTLISDGKAVTAVGDLATEADKTAALAAAALAAAGLETKEVKDTVRVSPLINAWDGLTDLLAKLPAFEAGKAGVNAARPGGAWRAGVVHSIYFATGSAKKSQDQVRALNQIQRLLSSQPSARFEISGHTDNVGDKEANQKLSVERANNFKTWLTQNGVIADFLTTRGGGPDEPIADNSTDAGKALNRRVDVTLR